MNSFSLQGGFNIIGSEPIDSRILIDDINNVTLDTSWKQIKPYNGLIISDRSGEVRVCTNAGEFADPNSWKKIGGNTELFWAQF